MKHLNAKIFHSIISRKIALKMFFIYLAIYLFVLALLLFLITPALKHVALENAENKVSVVAEELKNAQTTLETYSNTLYDSDYMLKSLKDFSIEQNERNFALVEQALSKYVFNNNLLLAATLEDYQHNYFSSLFFENVVTYESALNDAHYQKLFDYQKGSYYTYIPNDSFYAVNSNSTYSYHVMVLVKIIYLNHQPYILRSYYNMNSLVNHFRLLTSDTFSDYAIISPQNELLFFSDNYLDCNVHTSLDKNAFSHTSGQIKLTTDWIFYSKSPVSGWTFVAHAPFQTLYRETITIFLIITLLYLFSPFLYVLFLIPTTSKSLAPLEKLVDAMNNYSPESAITLDINTKDEIEDLSKHFNKMTAKIKRQVEEIKEKEHINSVVNYKLLATQIDPHFIYNTMNIINIMARQGNTDAIIEINNALIKILRERLNSKLSIVDTIENELETLYQYNLIMDYRYEKRIHTHVDVDDSLLSSQIPKNILQPLVENAFYHGFKDLDRNQEGHLDIILYPIDENIIIEISDDGNGIEESRLEKLKKQSYNIYSDKKPHIGLDNIRQRLQYIYPEQYQFDIQSTLGYGTTIIIVVPKKPVTI